MTSHSRHSVTPVTLAPLFRPEQIAEALGCSEWWVKEQARRHRIPFTRVGGSYRFTADHFAEIVQLFEQRPTAPCAPAEAAPGHRRRPRQLLMPTEPSVRLQARIPRRALRAMPGSAPA